MLIKYSISRLRFETVEGDNLADIASTKSETTKYSADGDIKIVFTMVETPLELIEYITNTSDIVNVFIESLMKNPETNENQVLTTRFRVKVKISTKSITDEPSTTTISMVVIA